MAILLRVLCGLLCLCAYIAQADSLDVTAQVDGAIGKHLSYLTESDRRLSVSEAMTLYQAGEFTPSQQAVLTLGIAIKPTWLAFQVNNPSVTAITKSIAVENAWLNLAEGYVYHNGMPIGQFSLGDALPFQDRNDVRRFFYQQQDFAPGLTIVIMRVDSPDPFVVPLFMLSDQQIEQRSVFSGYSYGFLYGACIALLLFYFIIFIRIKELSFLIYAMYIMCFIGTNLAYTGHAVMWLWPASPHWQQWAPPTFMHLYCIFGYLFAMYFLEIPRRFATTTKLLFSLIALQMFLLLLLISIGAQASLMLVTFAFTLLFSILMVYLGAISLKNGPVYTRYFFLGSLSATLGTSTTALTVWGVLPYTDLGFRAVELGMLSDVILLSLALAEKFKLNDDLKHAAIALSRIDPLTQLFNRRGFMEIMQPLWSDASAQSEPASLLLLDIDNFKRINDLHGHNVGDVVIETVASVIATCADSKDICGRWGGEEYIVFMPQTSALRARKLADDICAKVASASIAHATGRLRVSISIGVATQSAADMTFDELIMRADKCLYQAKHDGKNRVNATELSVSLL